MRSQTDGLTVGQAIALGALHGPAELLPISSSAHTSAIPWLLGWRYGELDPAVRKSFEVALHGGTAVAMLKVLSLQRGGRRQLLVSALSAVPPAIAGYALEREIEAKLGTPATTAAALIAGSVAMVLADHSPQERRWDDAGAGDALWLGIAQACALLPGVSRLGATVTAARFLRFRAEDSRLLAEHTALPVLVGASVLKAVRLRDLDPDALKVSGVGAAAAFVSTLACVAPTRRAIRNERLWPYALYRVALAGLLAIQRRKLTSNAHDQGHTGSV